MELSSLNELLDRIAARSAVGPTMTSRVIENRLRVSSEYSEQMNPTELSSLNELLD